MTQRVEGRDLGLRMVELRGFQAAGLGSLCWRPQEQGPASLGPSLASGVPSLMLLIAAVLWTGGKPGCLWSLWNSHCGAWQGVGETAV